MYILSVHSALPADRLPQQDPWAGNPFGKVWSENDGPRTNPKERIP
jgi:hypothetical protein